MPSPLRRHPAEDDSPARASFVELFFDLVFVLAVTQLSSVLIDDLTVPGAAETLFLLLTAWWAWIYTTWMTNWFDGETRPVRAILLVGMLASLCGAIAIPEAFGDRAGPVRGRLRRHPVGSQRVHGAGHPAGRSPSHAARAHLRVERMGQHHLACRCAGGGRRAHRRLPIVAGIIVAAVAAELVIAHPGEELHGNDLLPLAAGPGLFLVGSLVFKASVLHAQWRQRLLAVVAVFGVTVSGAFVPALAAWSLVLVVLGALALYETVELRRTASAAA